MKQGVYKDILINGPLAFACHRVKFDKEGNATESMIQEASRAFCTMCGIAQPDGKSFSALFPPPPEEERSWTELMGKIIREGLTREILIAGSDGEGTIVQLYTPDEEHCVTIIHKQKSPLPSETIESGGQDMTSLFNMMTLGVVYQNAEGKIIAANPSAEKILGLTAGELKGRTSHDPRWKAIREDGTEWPGNEHPVMQALKTGKPVFGKIMGIFNPCSGTTRWILVDAVPEFLNGDPEPYRAFTTFNDITEQKLTEIRLSESEEKMAGIYQVAPAGIGFLKDRVFHQVNRMVCELTGYSEEELIGQSARILYPTDEEYEYVGREKYRQISEHGTGTVQTRWKRKDGTLLSVILSSTPVNREDIGKGVIFTALDISDKQKAEDELKESEQKFRAAFYISPDLVSITRLSDGMFVNVNDAYIEKSGYTRQELIGRTSLEMKIWENPLERQVITDLLRKHGKVVNIEVNFRIKDGTTMTGLMSAGILEISGEEHLLAFTRDITERKKMETALISSEELYRTVVSSSSEGIVLQNREGKILTWNRAAEQILGIPSDRAIGQSFASYPFLFHNEAGDLCSDQKFPSLYTLNTGKPLRNVQLKTQRGGNETIWLNLNTSPVFRGGSDKPDRVVTTFSDITSIRNAQEALMASAEVARSIPSGLFVYRYEAPGHLMLIECNPAALELTRLRYEEGIGKEFNDIWKGEAASGFKKECIRMMQSSGTFMNTEIYYEDIRVSAFFRISAFKIGASKLGIAFDDVSELKIAENERRKAEEHIMKLNGELENRVEERTLELQVANKELEAFAYTVSHDLRAPLRAIDGFAGILKEDYENLLNDDGKKVLGIIGDNTRQMGMLIDDLLAFSRYSRSEMNLSQVDMNQLVSRVYHEITNNDQKEAIAFSIKPLPWVMADISLIKQVWTNLISNAVKFTSGRENPEIVISGKRADNKIQFEISDNGVGFNMKYAGKLFGVFQRLHSTKEFDGSGVGLAIVQRIVIRHGGSVWAHAEPGKGASFYFSLPDRKGSL